MSNNPIEQRLTALRAAISRAGMDGWYVPMSDQFQSEYVPAEAQRLKWLTGFTGSAGTVLVLGDRAAIFVDGRYTLQVRSEVPEALFDHQDMGGEAAWLQAHMPQGGTLGYDPNLSTPAVLAPIQQALKERDAASCAMDNLIDPIWKDRPAASRASAFQREVQFSGESAEDKISRMAERVKARGADVAAITAPENLAWLLNVRGHDLGHTPLVLSYGLLFADGQVDWFLDLAKLDPALREALGHQVRARSIDEFKSALQSLAGRAVLIDRMTASVAVHETLKQAGATLIEAQDPIFLAKAQKNAVEADGMRSAHRRDGVALCRFLHWLDVQAGTSAELDEIGVADHLAGLRGQGNLFHGLSFPTIAGSGPNGAIVHYQADEKTNRVFGQGELLLVDSGGQYLDGTTDVTRTMPIGAPADPQMIRHFTLVLKGHIALARQKFPKGTTGHQLDALARAALWQEGLDFKHGTGHGVGSFLGVHEGPQGISPRANATPLVPGMVISNEPGYYATEQYGIRIENLVLVVPAVQDGFLQFEDLTLAPIDRRLIDSGLLTAVERKWLDRYHARVLTEIGPDVPEDTRRWLEAACAPIC